MPRGDGMGPAGFGPMTGRGAGYCAGFSVPGYANPVPGRGFGMGFGRGFRRGGYGRRNMFYGGGMPGFARFGGYPPYPGAYQQPDPEWEKNALKNQAEALRSELDFIKARLEELEKGAPEK
ncbi:MAG: DUF5320 domain-containing protein [bacterium]